MSTRAPVPTEGGAQIAGIPVRDGTILTLADELVELAERPGTHVAVGVNAHLVNLGRKDEQIRDFLAGSVNYADGQSVVWAARFLGGRLTERVATTDLAEPLLRAAAARGLPVFFFGGAPAVAEAAAERLRGRVDGLDVRTQHGYVTDHGEVLEEIRRHETAILFVGLGDPLQQRWVTEHRDRLPPLVLTCGGLFDWLSESNPRAPRWMIVAGLEWLWRLGLEPRRLGRRYLLGNPMFVAAVLQERVGRRRPTARGRPR